VRAAEFGFGIRPRNVQNERMLLSFGIAQRCRERRTRRTRRL